MGGGLVLDFRWDKYEAKTKYWYEEDVEQEWEKEKGKQRNETVDYTVETSAEDVGVSMSTPLLMDVNQGRGGHYWLFDLDFDWLPQKFPSPEKGRT